MRTFNAGVEDSKSKPIEVIVERGEIVHIQHHMGVGVGVIVVVFIIIVIAFLRISI